MFIRQSNNKQLCDLPDQTLISNFQKTAEHIYFNELHRRYAHLVFGACLNHLKDREDARDMCMLIFEKLFQKLPTEQPQQFQSWLYYFTKNECISSLRKKQFASTQQEEWEKLKNSEENFMENEAAMRLYTDDTISINKEIALQQAMDQLSKAQKKCIQLFYLKHQSYKQIAKATNFSETEVKSHLQNGKRKLRLSVLALTENSGDMADH